MTKIKNAKNAGLFHCEECHFNCSKLSNWNAHITTRKHEIRTNTNKYEPKKCRKLPNDTKVYNCDCGSHFKHASSLWNHKQHCSGVPHSSNDETLASIDLEDKDEVIDKLMVVNSEMMNMVTTLVTQNQEMQKTMMELTKSSQVTNNTINNTHTNSHNKTFNLQFFLNETCKDAMNITDFVNSLKLNLHDLEKVGELGYAEGISRMFVKGLNELEVTRRPIHCSDLKREIIHIKDHDKWERDNSAQDRLKRAIKELSNKNIMLLDDWQKENPGCTEYDHRKNDIYLRMVMEAMGPSDEVSEKKDFGKIIRTIAKTTIIDKTIQM